MDIDLLRSGQLAGTKRLNLSCGLTEFPPEIFDLANSLEILDLSRNHLKSLPNEFGRLKKLKIVFFTDNAFEEIPAILSQCPDLYMVSFKSNDITTFEDNALPPTVRWLILTDNRIEQLPASIGRLKSLQKLMLAGNKLQSLPDEMAACLNLELIRLSANRLKSLPAWLFTLPRLSWLAYAGNPCCYVNSLVRSLLDISWTDLQLGDTLGQGASGVISKGIWNTEHNQKLEVAVKVFKGEITSDGLPVDEMHACIAAGAHENLVRILGKLINHPEDKAGLVLSFIPPNYKNLGEPPDLDSCTRDRYSSGASFPLTVILRIVKGIAAAAAHLHARGIMHGDLYAHNILVNEAGDSLLGDFGAASFYDSTDPSVGQMMECLEVRAFGCLLEEMLDHCELKSSQAAIATLRGLQQDCMNHMPSKRPSFIKICEVLDFA